MVASERFMIIGKYIPSSEICDYFPDLSEEQFEKENPTELIADHYCDWWADGYLDQILWKKVFYHSIELQCFDCPHDQKELQGDNSTNNVGSYSMFIGVKIESPKIDDLAQILNLYRGLDFSIFLIANDCECCS